MRLGWALFVTLALFTVSVKVSLATETNLSFLMVLGSAAWASIDSAALGLQRFKSRLAVSPVAVFLAIALLWILCFPTYLMLRQKIQAGELELKDPPADEAA